MHNAIVQLEPNDIIRFSYNGIPYEFLLESSSMVCIYLKTSELIILHHIERQMNLCMHALWQKSSSLVYKEVIAILL